MEKLRILVSAYAFNPNAKTPTDFDPGVLAWNLVDRLRRYYDIWVITHSENTDCVMDELSAGALPKVNIHFVNLPKCWRFANKTVIGRWFCYYRWQRSAWKYSRDLHSQVQFDAFHHLTLEYDWVPSFAGAYLPVPFIWGPLGGGERPPQGFDTGMRVLERWKNVWHLIGQWLGRRHHARKESEVRARAILICNQETRHRFSKTDVRNFHYFPLTGISEDTIRSNPKKRASDRSTFRVISSGILDKKSGFDLAIEAFSLFSKSSPDSDYVIFGEGSERSQLERKIQEHNLEPRVRIHPWISSDDLHERMRDSDVFLSTGLQDRSGFFVVRALSAGLPVVCLDSGGPGMIVQEKWGILIKPEDPEQSVLDLAEALKDLCTDKARRRKMSLAALKNAKEHYTWEGLAKRLKRIYGEVLLQEEDIRFSKRGEERFFY
ncbi:MAG: glycosyltransferase [Candidatus Aminicenantes bacterium]|jgi:glycosyltransferase involved in cell wall biosynthesis